MRFRKALILAVFILLGFFFGYYFVLLYNSMQLLRPRHNWGDILKTLEADIHLEEKRHKLLAKTIVNVLKIKYLDDALTSHDDAGVLALSTKLYETNEGNVSGKTEAFDNELQRMIPSTTALTHLSNGDPVIPVLVIACNRTSVSICLERLLEYRPDQAQFPIIVSQDCAHKPTKEIISKYFDEVSLIEQPNQSKIHLSLRESKLKGYFYIARHYIWALNNIFARGYEMVIIVEDDLLVSPDFFAYFLGTYRLLKEDPSLWCISAWNDNGRANFINFDEQARLYRTDFFPGLGWMLTKELWQELSPKWPKSFWDDWMRDPLQRKNRSCIRPEISRTATFGKTGVSQGLFYDNYLKYIELSKDYVPFDKLDLSYLLKANYDEKFLKEVYSSLEVTYGQLRGDLTHTNGSLRLQYMSMKEYKRLTKMLGLMDDTKSGVPRTGYHGIVPFYWKKRRVYLAPVKSWQGYKTES